MNSDPFPLLLVKEEDDDIIFGLKIYTAPRMDVCLSPLEDGACVRASVTPPLLPSCSFAILLNIASLKTWL